MDAGELGKKEGLDSDNGSCAYNQYWTYISEPEGIQQPTSSFFIQIATYSITIKQRLYATSKRV